MFDAMFTLIGHSGAYANKRGLHPPRGIHGRGAGRLRVQGRQVRPVRHARARATWSGSRRRRASPTGAPSCSTSVEAARRDGQSAAARPPARAVPDAHRRRVGGSRQPRRRGDRLGAHHRRVDRRPTTRANSAPWCSSTTRSSDRPGWPACPVHLTATPGKAAGAAPPAGRGPRGGRLGARDGIAAAAHPAGSRSRISHPLRGHEGRRPVRRARRARPAAGCCSSSAPTWSRSTRPRAAWAAT